MTTKSFTKCRLVKKKNHIKDYFSGSEPTRLNSSACFSSFSVIHCNSFYIFSCATIASFILHKYALASGKRYL